MYIAFNEYIYDVENVKIEYEVLYKQSQNYCIHVSVIHTHAYMYQDNFIGV